MRRLIFAAALLVVATGGFVSASLAAAHRTLTFAERFSPALELMAKH